MLRDLGFVADYQCEILPGLPGSGSVPLQFHREGQRTHSEGLVIRVTPNHAKPWMGNFQYGDEKLSEVYASPSEETVCVVAQGQGYLVPVNHPAEYEVVRAYPIKNVFAIPDRRLIVFADFTKLTAYGPKGIAWETQQLSWDGLKITRVTSEAIQGLAWDSPHQKEVEFLIDTKTGRHQGGSSPETYTGRQSH